MSEVKIGTIKLPARKTWRRQVPIVEYIKGDTVKDFCDNLLKEVGEARLFTETIYDEFDGLNKEYAYINKEQSYL